MRSLRNFKVSRRRHLIGRIANRAFFLDKKRFAGRLWRDAAFLAAAASLLWACGKDRDGLNVHILDCGIDDKVWNDVASFWFDRFGKEFAVIRHVVDMSKLDHVAICHGSRATLRFSFNCLGFLDARGCFRKKVWA